MVSTSRSANNRLLGNANAGLGTSDRERPRIRLSENLLRRSVSSGSSGRLVAALLVGLSRPEVASSGAVRSRRAQAFDQIPSRGAPTFACSCVASEELRYTTAGLTSRPDPEKEAMCLEREVSQPSLCWRLRLCWSRRFRPEP